MNQSKVSSCTTMMAYNKLAIIATLCLIKTINGFQPWSLQSNTFQSSSSMDDLKFCIVWPWQGQQARSILRFDVIKCQPNEICSPVPNMQIHGMQLG